MFTTLTPASVFGSAHGDRAAREVYDGWWEDSSHLETLCALVVWRDWIDQVADDPRHELAFHVQLGATVGNFAKRAAASRGHGCPVRRPASGLAWRSLEFGLRSPRKHGYAWASSRIWRTGWRPNRPAIA